ncbi:hypothetical protein DSM106972_046330 [Dulcicalothrix desertica PCC 7102]|uniref:Filamentous haemagglutinin FhaB/tRNA nuclease CdiA-like TPS domain-containing protein n=1 Tax=Dulcicalothrix desertica PCC 7102 TaxID=232991 RepID=A0A433VE74_9CYAN|nr:S-layer family protein [Dulcicalothrix desertica]RUT04405.1 hypothetical protein DSM106972_046330 [Dulcicalothrix desertica PCC 7102]TWH51260.1 filamentous hemagglutinin family protein [Dulcicalothrix desertica PCC 7102]
MIGITRFFLHMVVTICSTALLANSSYAQILPDTTLLNKSNVINSGNTRVISGGTTVGANLFHSFSEFSIPSSATVLFNNALDIQNIISRVTGKSTSVINGLIQSNGTANLFLINPNGIIFGKDASLNIGGSFVATTADAVRFGQSEFFSASNPEAPSPLLTVNPNALLFNQIVAAPIQNSSIAPAGKNPAGLQVSGLRVRDGKSLLLVGGKVNIDGGQLNAFGGRVELSGLASTGTVALQIEQDNFRLSSFDESAMKADVSLANQSRVSVEAGGGGSIAVNARNLEVSGASVVSAGIGNGLGTANRVAGDITLNATEEIKVDGAGSYVFNRVRPQAVGNGGNVTVNTRELLVRNGAQVGTSTFGAGNGGNLEVSAQTVQLIGRSAQFRTSLYAATNANAIGNGGNLTIKAGSLLVQDGAQVSSDTFGAGKGGSLTVNANIINIIGASGLFAQQNTRGATGKVGDLTINTKTLSVRDGAKVSGGTFGAGKGGNLNVNADTVSVIGSDIVNGSSSRLSTQNYRGATGNAGDLTITAKTLSVQDGAQVSSGTFGAGESGNLKVNVDTVSVAGNNTFDATSSKLTTQNEGVTGNAGNLTITGKTLLIRDGGQIGTGIFGGGNGGNLTVNVDTVQVIGNNTFDGSRSGLFTSTGQNSTGAAGDLKINAQQLLVGDKAGVFVKSLGLGNAGNLSINARSITLDDGTLSGDTRSIKTNPNKSQATITLQVKDLLLLRRGSNITTNATGENVIGGDINIYTNILAAFQNSDITANSDDYRGGNVIINTRSLFGIQFRDVASRITSDITASGATRELSGNVEITTPDIDPTNSLIELSTNLVDASQQISTACTPGSRQYNNSFVATGRSGLPISPTEPLQDQNTYSAWVRFQGKPENLNTASTNKPPLIAANPTIIEASGWIADTRGNIELVAPDKVSPKIKHSFSCTNSK